MDVEVLLHIKAVGVVGGFCDTLDFNFAPHIGEYRKRNPRLNVLRIQVRKVASELNFASSVEQSDRDSLVRVELDSELSVGSYGDFSGVFWVVVDILKLELFGRDVFLKGFGHICRKGRS